MLHIKKNQNINLIKYLVILISLRIHGFSQGSFALILGLSSAILVVQGFAGESGKMIPDLIPVV